MTVDDDGFVSFFDWLDESKWASDFDAFQETFAEFFEDSTELDYDVVLDRMSPDYYPTLDAFLDESYLASHETDEVVRAYEKETGQSPRSKPSTYLRAIRESTCSVYEVVESVPGSHLILRDLLQPADRVKVEERSASRSLVQWDVLVTRLVHINRTLQISGGTIPVRREGLGDLKELHEQLLRVARREMTKEARANPVLLAAVAALAAEEVGKYALVDWILDASPDPAMRPTLVNMDGDGIEFVSLAFPLLAGQDAVRSRLNAADDFPQSDSEGWAWIQTTKGESIVHAILHIEGDRLLAECNSGKRAKKLTERLSKLLGRTIGKPLKLKSTPERELSLNPTSAPVPMADFAPEMREELERKVAELLRERYRKTLNEFVPMLEGTPRDLVKTKKGREKVVNWLKLLESSHAHTKDLTGAKFDFIELWKDLGILKLRV